MSSQQPRRLRDLRRDSMPPADLEERVVRALKAGNLIRSTTRGVANLKTHYAITAAVAVAALVAGLAVGQRFNAAPAETQDESPNQYIMLLYENASYQRPEPGRMEERVGEYSQWARDIAATGKYVTGKKLADEGLLLEPDGARVAVLPTAEQGVLAGYFVISATDLDEAASIAENCPHLRYGGTVSLRPMES